jgi:hypothetical protein
VKSDPALIAERLDLPVEAVALDVRLRNSIPLEGTIKFLAGQDTSAMDTLISAPIPRLDIIGHRVASADTAFTVRLSHRGIQLFKRQGVYTRQVLFLNGTQGESVWLFGEDSLSVWATAHITYTVNAPEEN